jgi:hypothetical protein
MGRMSGAAGMQGSYHVHRAETMMKYEHLWYVEMYMRMPRGFSRKEGPLGS